MTLFHPGTCDSLLPQMEHSKCVKHVNNRGGDGYFEDVTLLYYTFDSIVHIRVKRT